jgi:hypothetical protein
MIRNFRLWNENKTISFSLNTSAIKVEDIRGLGLNMDILRGEGIQNKFVYNINANFTDIELGIYFGLGTNAYSEYKKLMDFIALNGKKKMLLEYNFNNRQIYCDIYFKQSFKSQKNRFGVLTERFIFARTSYWYLQRTFNFTVSQQYLEEEFPLDFPISFEGEVPFGKLSIDNTFFEDLEVNIKLTNKTAENLEITIENKDEETISKTIITKELLDGEYFFIKSEERKVIFYNSETEEEENGYDFLDRENNTFIIIPPGQHYLDVGLKPEDETIVEINYKVWVPD